MILLNQVTGLSLFQFDVGAPEEMNLGTGNCQFPCPNWLPDPVKTENSWLLRVPLTTDYFLRAALAMGTPPLISEFCQLRTLSHDTGGGESGQEELSFPRYKNTMELGAALSNAR